MKRQRRATRRFVWTIHTGGAIACLCVSCQGRGVTVDLKIGAFYWVLIVLDVDTDQVWENEPMPARFAGRNEAGELLWNYLDTEGISDWPVRWIGPEIVPPL